MLTLLMSALVSFSQPAHAASSVGFSSGDYFESQRISGDITVFCDGGKINHFRCQSEILKPGEVDYFQGPSGIQADRVELVATHSDGSVKSKSKKYDSAKGRSKDRFNLWLRSLTQSPLLEVGTNKIEYKMTKAGSAVTGGQFSVEVKRIEPATCRPSTYTSGNPSDCEFGDTICDYYFRDENYCQ